MGLDTQITILQPSQSFVESEHSSNEDADTKGNSKPERTSKRQMQNPDSMTASSASAAPFAAKLSAATWSEQRGLFDAAYSVGQGECKFLDQVWWEFEDGNTVSCQLG